MVFCVDHKMAMMETGLYYKIFSYICAQHHHHCEHDIPILYTFVYLPIFIILDQALYVCVLQYTCFFEIHWPN